MKVTIIITNYNKASYLKEAINSALNQTYNNTEVIIIDDGSTDNSKEIISTYKYFLNINIIYQENEGVIYTRNKAISLASGELIVQLDGDDILNPIFIEKAVDCFVDTTSRIVYGKTEFIGSKIGDWDLGEYSLKKQLLSNQIPISAMFLKRDFNNFGGYDEKFKNGYEDWDFWLNLIINGVTVNQIYSPMLKYRVIENSRNNSIDLETLTDINNKIFQKYSNFYNKNFSNPIILQWEVQKLQEVEKSFNIFKVSKEYKLGELLLKPYRYFMKLLRRAH